MSVGPFGGAFRHQHGDPRGLRERIQAQLRERIEEAVEMAAIRLLVELRQRQGRPAPETSREADRRQFEQIARELLEHLDRAFSAGLDPELARALTQAQTAEAEARERLLTGQVFLARRLSDYWQRFEAYDAGFREARLAPPPERNWLGRLFSGS